MKILDRMTERETEASKLATRARNDWKDSGGESRANKLGYYEGRASAMLEAQKLMKHELAKLKNKFQNGSLSIDDFPFD